MSTKKKATTLYWTPPGQVKAVKPAEAESMQAFTAKDEELFKEQESVIASNIGAFLRLGEALCIIKDRNLQTIRDPKFTFEHYCLNKWDFGKAYAYRLMGGYKCVQNLKEEMAPHGVILFPTNEAQVRPLTSLPSKKQVQAWAAVLKKAEGGNITAAMVEETVNGNADKPAKSHRVSGNPAAVKAEHKKMQTIAKLVENALGVDPSERSIKQLSKVLMKIQSLVKGVSL